MKSNSWNKTKGVIIESKLLNHGRSMMIGKNYERYSALIKYEYKVLDENFESNRIRFFPMGTSTSKKAVEHLTSLYSKGSQIEVFYDPARPDQAILQRGLNFKSLFAFVGISLFIFTTIWMIQNE